MDILLTQIAKRYRYDWIYRNLDYHFQAGHSYAILGPNGSGKSTLLRVLSGHLTPSRGKVVFKKDGKEMAIDEVYRYMSYAAPYIDVIEELTLTEAIAFHRRFKNFVSDLPKDEDVIALLGFQKSADKQIRNFSSGMKQRLKLVFAICTDTPVLLLDEPTTNLDQQGFDWYRMLIEKYAKGRLVIVASNVAMDYDFCDEVLNIEDYKK
ncbi:MAG: ATP-binding cassette domain-containing protein [Saprospiraceae bacterium]